MKCFDGKTSLVINKEENRMTVFFIGTQIIQEEMEYIESKLPVEVSKDENYAFQLFYILPEGTLQLRQLLGQIKSNIDRLEIALKLKELFSRVSVYRLPFVHPENIILKDTHLEFIHLGIQGSLEPMEQDSSLSLSQYKSLALSIINPKASYESLVNGENSLKDRLSQAIADCSSIDEVHQLIQKEWQQEKNKQDITMVRVSKNRYQFFKYAGSLSVVAVIGMGVLTFIDKKTIIPRQNAVVAAQADFITNHYDSTLDDLKNYQPDQLPKEARFILASSSIHLADLSQTQKNSILNNISSTTDDNTLNYWIYQGRGDFEKALNLSKNIGDDQLTLLAYTDLYQSTKLNTSMDGEEKQKLLEEYNKQIQELSKSLGK